MTDEGHRLQAMTHRLEGTELIPTATQSVVGLLAFAVFCVVMACYRFSRGEYLEKPGDA